MNEQRASTTELELIVAIRALLQIHTWLGTALSERDLENARGLIEDAWDEAGAAGIGSAEEIS